MANDFIDTHYAYAQLGLDIGAPFEHIRGVLENAVAYRFCTRPRMETIERFVEFFTARTVFGTLESSFIEIRMAYHDQAKALHPDTNRDNAPAEEQLKVINAAYEVIAKVHKEAREYYDRDVEARYEIEKQAREIRKREAEAKRDRAGERLRHPGFKADPSWAGYAARTRQAEEEAAAHYAPAGPIRYMAASVPRYIRLSRLFYLSRHTIIGSRSLRCSGGRILVYDVIMLPEMEFKRAKLNLGIEGHGSPELTMSRLVPAYIPIDTKTILVPKGEENPYSFAKAYFMEQFRLAPADGKDQPASA